MPTLQSKRKAVIWDMDGVIADTAVCHFLSWQHVFQKRGVNFSARDFRPKFGQRNDAIIKSTLAIDRESEIDAIAEEKEIVFRNLAKEKLKPFPGAVSLLKQLGRNGFKVALASSAPPENIELIITTLGIKDYFDVLVSGHEVTESKPSPQVFLLAAQKLGVKPENCLVIEDAIAGVTAAKRGGMHYIAVTNTNSRASLREADLVVDSLEGLTADDLARLMNSAAGRI